MKSTLYILVLLVAINLNGQQPTTPVIDSLRHEMAKANHDTTRINYLSTIVFEMAYEDADEAIRIGHEGYRLAKKIKWEKGIAMMANQISVAHYMSSNYDSAIYYVKISGAMDSTLSDMDGYQKCMHNLGTMYSAKGDFENSKLYFEKALGLAIKANDSLDIADVYNNIATIYSNQGDVVKMLDYDLKSLRIMEKLGDTQGMCRSYNNVAYDYMDLKDYKEAMMYAEKALALAIRHNDKSQTGNCYLTIGTVASKQGDYKKAYVNLDQAITMLEEVGQLNLVADAYNNYASTLAMENKLSEANTWLEKALNISVEIGDDYQAMYYRHQLGSNAVSQKQYSKAILYFEEALPVARADSALKDLEIIYSGMQKANAGLGRYDEAYKYTLLYNTVHDSLNSEGSSKQLSLIRTEFETEKKQHQIDLLNKDNELQIKEISKQKLIRNSTIAGLGFLAIFLGIVFVQKRRISKEKDRSENLLLNILPYETAQELKEKGSADAKLFDEVTVLFTDFKGFTMVAEKLTPTELVAEIHHCFKAFDEIMAEHNIEKIKTIGDAYMAAGGLPVKNKTNASDVIEAAFKIQKFMLNYKTQREAEGKSIFEIRIGIHTGPVVAGIVGIKKFQYDIWGDTVNTASRMESSGEQGKVNISGATYELVMDSYTCTYRGKIQAKNKGEIDMYFVEGRV
ncbi:MAG: adenylate/guanylate cyclase domain-containing protein [Flavobacteriales bacterium]